MPCEMCGAATRTRRVLIERAEMLLCERCAKFGVEATPVARKETGAVGTVADRLARRAAKRRPRDVFSAPAVQLVEGWNQRIKRAREAKGWERENLAGRIGEPVPTVTKFEHGELHPADDVARKLEKELAITLLEPVPDVLVHQKAGAAKATTLGDLLKDAMKKKAK